MNQYFLGHYTTFMKVMHKSNYYRRLQMCEKFSSGTLNFKQTKQNHTTIKRERRVLSIILQFHAHVLACNIIFVHFRQKTWQMVVKARINRGSKHP